jgi:hypothetical protein
MSTQQLSVLVAEFTLSLFKSAGLVASDSARSGEDRLA